MKKSLTIILAQPRGFCAGVQRAVDIVERALDKYGAPIYVRHEIVHNKFVVESLKQKGVIFVKEVDEVPLGAVAIFSAHGVSEAVESHAKQRELHVIDATCPLVTKVHKEAQRSEAEGRQVILIGHQGHPEVEGTSGRVNQEVLLVQTVADVAALEVADATKLSYVTQTTLSVDDTRDIISALTARFPDITGPDVNDICYATQNRQNAVKTLAKDIDALFVIGATNSSNSNRLRDLGEESGVSSYLISNTEDIQPDWLTHVSTIGVTAGASAPEVLVKEVITYFQQHYHVTLIMMDGVTENVKFKLPKEFITNG